MYQFMLQLGSFNNYLLAKARLYINMPSMTHLLYQYGLDWAEREQFFKGNNTVELKLYSGDRSSPHV